MPNEAKLLAAQLRESPSAAWTHSDQSVAGRAAEHLLKLDKQNRQYEKHLKGLVGSIEAFLNLLDLTMKTPANETRGKEIAQLCNSLDISKDYVRFFALDIDPYTGKKRKVKVPKTAKKRRARAV